MPKLDKNIYGGSFGGPILKDELFFFTNYERLREDSQAAVSRAVPSATMRDGVMVYKCANAAQCPGGTVQGFTDSHTIAPGYYGATPTQLAGIDPLGIGPSALASQYFKQLPLPNDPGLDGYNLMAYRFTAPFSNTYNTTLARFDFRPAGNQMFFGRFNIQRDLEEGVPQYPDLDLPPNTTRKGRNWGLATGWDTVFGTNLVNTFRYGFTELVNDQIGTLNGPLNYFRFIDNLNPGTSNSGRKTPTHNFVDDMTWLKGRHSLKFGANLRFTRVPSYTDANSYSSTSINPSWVTAVGRTSRRAAAAAACRAARRSRPWPTAGTGRTRGSRCWPSCRRRPAQYNYDRDGNPLPDGAPATRRYAADNYEFYFQDSWRMTDKLTVTGGVRYSLASPPWEVNGLQVAPTENLGLRFEQRRQMALDGVPENTLAPIEFGLAGPANNKPGYYNWDKNNFSPRVSAAWTPTPKWVIRGGYSLVYDRLGLALAQNFDSVGSYGLATSSTARTAGTTRTTRTSGSRGSTCCRTRCRGRRPAASRRPRQTARRSTLRSTPPSTMPYAHTFDVVVGRELTTNFTLEAAYIGRLGRNLLMRRDLLMPLDLVDQKSGTDYYAASKAVIQQLEQNGFNAMAVSLVAYFENLFPGAAGGGMTATQAMADYFAYYYPDFTSALFGADLFCDPACSIDGLNSDLHSEFAALAALSSVAQLNSKTCCSSRSASATATATSSTSTTRMACPRTTAPRSMRGSSYTSYENGGKFLINSCGTRTSSGPTRTTTSGTRSTSTGWRTCRSAGTGSSAPACRAGWTRSWAGGTSPACCAGRAACRSISINARSAWATNWNLQGNAVAEGSGQAPAHGHRPRTC